LIYKSRTPPRCNASTQLHLDLHSHSKSTLNRNTIKKREQGTNTPNGCADVTLNPKSKLDPLRLNPLSIFLNVQMNDLQERKNFVNL